MAHIKGNNRYIYYYQRERLHVKSCMYVLVKAKVNSICMCVCLSMFCLCVSSLYLILTWLVLVFLNRQRRTCVCLHVFLCGSCCACIDSSPTCAPELLAFNLADSFVSKPSGVAAASSTGLNRVVKQVVSQPLQVTVTHKGILGQMTDRGKWEKRGEKMGLLWEWELWPWLTQASYVKVILCNHFFSLLTETKHSWFKQNPSKHLHLLQVPGTSFL